MRCIAILIDHQLADAVLGHAAWSLDAALEVEVHEDGDRAMAWLVRRVLERGHAGVAYYLPATPEGCGALEVAGNVWLREGFFAQASIEGEETRTYEMVDGKIRRKEGA